MKRFFSSVPYALLFISTLANAQIAKYNFNANLEDQQGNYTPTTIFGTPDFSSGQYVALDSGEYFVLPNGVHQAIDTTESFEVNLRFKVDGDWEATPALDGKNEEARVIFTSKPEYDQRVSGFDITAREWEKSLWIITTFGDGTVDEQGLWSEGKLDFVSRINTGEWYDFTLKIFFDDELPYIQYIVNGTVTTSFFDKRMDYNGFKGTISKQPFVVGSTINNTAHLSDARHPSLDLEIDFLDIYSPVRAGDANIINSALTSLIEHMNGQKFYSSDQLDSIQSVFVTNWDDETYEPNSTIVHEYIDTYSATQGFVFTLQFNGESPQNFDALKGIQFQLEQWVFDNQYSADKVGQMEGVAFKEHEHFPGSVNPSAERLSNAIFTVDGNYQTDPGFYLNDEDYVRRPTGYFAPAGELVEITVPDEAIDQGLSIYVGATRKNLQEGWSEFRRFPRTSTIYALNAKTITVANPFGGGIYVAIPDSTQLGPLTFSVNGAVKAPYYSTKEGFSNSLDDFKTELNKGEVPYVDVESDNFMFTITHGMASQMNDVDSILTIWNKSFDAINKVLGRPQKRFRSEYMIQDRQNHAPHTAAPAAYPMSLEIYTYPYEPVIQQPIDVEKGTDWYKGPINTSFNYIFFHEYGHLHNMPTLYFEQETNVHLLATVAYSEAMGEPIDSAFVYAQVQRLNLEQATFDWLFSDNFINGNRIGPESPWNNPWDQLLYQSRGLVKLVDIAKMYGWEALAEINKYFYEYRLQNPNWSPYDLQDDVLIKAASEVMGFNMAPHFEFHGIIPSDNLYEELKTMETSDVIKKRILHYRSELPKSNDEFVEVYNQVARKLDPAFHVPRWDNWKAVYDEAYAQSIMDRIDTVLTRYYGTTAKGANYIPVIEGLAAEIRFKENTMYTFSLSDLLVTDLDHDFPADHVLIIGDGENYTLNGFEIIPSADFHGFLKIPVQVSDGIETSEVFHAEIYVISDEELNEAPIITGLHKSLMMQENTSITLSLNDLIVEDSDHTFPDDHQLKILDGAHYSVEGLTISPDDEFVGTLTASLVVSDGIEDSAPFNAAIEVAPVLSTLSQDPQYQLYPNPTEDGKIHVSGFNTHADYTLYNLNGNLLESGKLTDQSVQINHAAGYYILEIYEQGRLKFTAVVIKK